MTDAKPIRTRPARRAAPPVGRYTAAIFADLAEKTRFADPQLAARWGAIVGPEIAALCRPGRLTGAGAGRTLELVVRDGAAAARVEFEAEAIRRRLNDALGPGMIGRLSVRQKAGAAPSDPRLAAALSRFRAGVKKKTGQD